MGRAAADALEGRRHEGSMTHAGERDAGSRPAPNRVREEVVLPWRPTWEG